MTKLSVSVNICLGAFCIALAMSQLFHWKDFCGIFFSSFRKTWCPSERLSRWPGYWCASAPIQRQKSMCAPHLLTIRPAHQEETTVGGNVERRKAKRTEKQRRQSYCCNTHSLVAGRDENVHTVTECRVGGGTVHLWQTDKEKIHSLKISAKNEA